MYCNISLLGDTLEVRSDDQNFAPLHLDLSRFYCTLFESAQLQSRDYLEELMRWCGGTCPDNMEQVNSSLLHNVSAQRRKYGFKR